MQLRATTSDPQPPRGRSAIAAVLLLAVVLVGYYASFGRMTFSTKTFAFDLVSFYCGGEAVGAHADPYRVEPLRACEHRIVAPAHANSPLVIPAPQPAYVLGAMAAIHGLSYAALQVLVTLLEIAAFLATVRLLATLLPVSSWILYASLGLSDFYASVYLGQLAVFCTLGIVLVGVGLRRRSTAATTCGLALAACEPHVALPIFLAVFVFGSLRDRIAAVVTAGALLASSLAIVPLGVLREYAFTVLTTHAISETSNQDQLGLSYALRALGVAPDLAVTIGKFQYGAFAVASLAALGTLVKRYGREAIAFAPPAFVLIGGPFVHVTQMAAAIPALLMLFAQSGSRKYAIALFFLAIPWVDARALLTILPLVTACCAAIARYALRLRPLASLAIAVIETALVGYAGFTVANERVPDATSYGPIAANDLAEVPWQRVVELKAHTHVIIANLEKLPTEIALAIVLVGLLLPLIARTRAAQTASSSRPEG